MTGKRRLVITVDHSTGNYVIDTPDGQINYVILGEILSDFLLKYFDPAKPPVIGADGVIDLNQSEEKPQEKLPTKKGYVN